MIKVIKDLKYLSTGQIDRDIEYSTAQALTRTAFDVRQSTQNRLPTWVNLTRTFLPRSVVVDKATITDQRAFVGFLPRADFALLLEEGGVRRKHNARNVSIPAGVRRTGRGGVSRANRPPQLLKKKGYFLDRWRGKLGLWKVVNRNDLRLEWRMRPFTTYRKGNINFIDNAFRVVDVKYRRNVEQQLQRNLKKSIERVRRL